MARASFKDKDRGYKRRVKDILGLKPTSITVGIHAEEGSQIHEQKNHDERTTTTVLDIGTIHEFGLGNCPERSFIRGWADENKGKNEQTIRTMMKSVAQGKRTMNDAADIIGFRFVGDIQKRIKAGIPPGLKQATIDRKGSSTPLIDTGQLRSSILHKVNFGK